MHRIVHRTVRDPRRLLLIPDEAVLVMFLRIVRVVEHAHRVPAPVATGREHDGVLDRMRARARDLDADIVTRTLLAGSILGTHDQPYKPAARTDHIYRCTTQSASQRRSYLHAMTTF